MLAVSGMRVGEALGLDREDVDLADGVITGPAHQVRPTKVGSPAPEHHRGAARLRRTTGIGCVRGRRADTFFVSHVGTALDQRGVAKVSAPCPPSAGHPHRDRRTRGYMISDTAWRCDTLIDWQRDGSERRSSAIGVLSAYLGHVSPADTYWYLSAAPELMQLAAARLDALRGRR